MPPKPLDRKRLRHLVTMLLLALEGPDDGSVVEAARALWREAWRPRG